MANLTEGNITMRATYVDDVTGYTGRATAYAKYDTGEVTVLIEATDANGYPTSKWVDVTRLSFATERTVTA